MNRRDHRAAGGYRGGRKDLQIALTALVNALEDYHASNPELHQLYLESLWLLDSSIFGTLVMPSSWDLILYKMIDNAPLSQVPHANAYAKALVNVLSQREHEEEAVG
jgi:hypothetical protein